jgi:mannitol-1-phosphate/altronate dehydrogenase
MPINDPMSKKLVERARSGGKDPQSLLSMQEVFSESLASSPRFVDQVRDFLESFYDKGARATLAKALS